jgi:hypothetical protein
MTIKDQPIQVHILQAFMTHEHYRGKSAVDILNLNLPEQLELDVIEHLGIKDSHFKD